MDAIRKTVSSVIGVFEPMSASPCPVERLEPPVAYDADREADRRMAVQDLAHRSLQLQLIDRWHGSSFPTPASA
jgi:hypothetical protein